MQVNQAQLDAMGWVEYVRRIVHVQESVPLATSRWHGYLGETGGHPLVRGRYLLVRWRPPNVCLSHDDPQTLIDLALRIEATLSRPAAPFRAPGQGDGMTLLAQCPKRIVITPTADHVEARVGWSELADDEKPVRGEAEYVRADLHRGAVDDLREMCEALEAVAILTAKSGGKTRLSKAWERARLRLDGGQ